MKPTIKTGFGVCILLAISCSKEPLRTPTASSAQAEDNMALQTTAHFIGERFGGGIIFWLTKDGQHGLIADTVDIGVARWWNGSFLSTGATERGIGSGRTNTRKIVAVQGEGSYAAYLCATYKGSGCKDWFLPSKDELSQLFKQKQVVGGFAECCYWSSTEVINEEAWDQFFTDGSRENEYKANESNVRAVRSF